MAIQQSYSEENFCHLSGACQPLGMAHYICQLPQEKRKWTTYHLELKTNSYIFTDKNYSGLLFENPTFKGLYTGVFPG